MADRLVPIDTGKPSGSQFPGLVSAEIQALIHAAGGGGASTVVDVFTANGTWTRRPGAVSVNVRVVGGGGGGAAGAKGPAGSALVGGGGGGSGGMSESTFSAADLPAFVPVSVGKGGAAVAGQSANSTAGANGNPGGTTTFGSGSAIFLRGGSGLGGTGGGTAAGGTGGVTGGGMVNGAHGGAGSATGGPGAAASWSLGPAAGGAGGGVTAAGVAGAGGEGGYTNTTGMGGAKGGSGAVGANGYVSAVKGPGGGGGGGGASVTGNGFAGGSGGGCGGGGGGGGAALNDKGTSGGGGAGGDGICIVVTTIGPVVAAAAFTEVASYTLQASDKEKRFEEPTRVTVPADLAVRKGKRVVLAGEYVEVVPDGDDGGAFPAAVVHGEAVLVRVSSTEWDLTGDVAPLAAEDDVLPVPVGDPDADGLYPTSADEPVAVEVVDPEASPERE